MGRSISLPRFIAGILPRMALVVSLAFCAAFLARAEAPPVISNALEQPRLSGQGEYRWFGLKLYDALLWVEDRGLQATAPLAAPLALELVYARSFKGMRIADASIKEIRKLRIGNDTQHQAWLNAMERIFPDVEEGTRIIGIHHPGTGARFYRNGREIGRVDDAEFSRAFFSIWLAEQTSAPALRSALLAKAGSR